MSWEKHKITSKTTENNTTQVRSNKPEAQVWSQPRLLHLQRRWSSFSSSLSLCLQAKRKSLARLQEAPPAIRHRRRHASNYCRGAERRGGAANERLSTVNSWRLRKKLSLKIAGLPLELMAEPSAGSHFLFAISVVTDQPHVLHVFLVLLPLLLLLARKRVFLSLSPFCLQLLPGFFCTHPPLALPPPPSPILIISLSQVWNQPCEIKSTPFWLNVSGGKGRQSIHGGLRRRGVEVRQQLWRKCFTPSSSRDRMCLLCNCLFSFVPFFSQWSIHLVPRPVWLHLHRNLLVSVTVTWSHSAAKLSFSYAIMTFTHSLLHKYSGKKNLWSFGEQNFFCSQKIHFLLLEKMGSRLAEKSQYCSTCWTEGLQVRGTLWMGKAKKR